jgi:hypothetical protein
MAYKYETNAKLLDELMGTNRDHDRKVEVIEVCTTSYLGFAISAQSLGCRILRTPGFASSF